MVDQPGKTQTTAKARYMTAEEMAECERLTLEAHARVRGALSDADEDAPLERMRAFVRQLPWNQRRTVMQSMRRIGMSLRQIATEFGLCDARDKMIARAAREMALEKTAQLVEAEPHDPSYGMSGGLMRQAQLSTCAHLAEAIRALKEDQHG